MYWKWTNQLLDLDSVVVDLTIDGEDYPSQDVQLS